jgi:hypothetical protein
MTKGILIYALNNKNIDYIKIALYAATQAKKFLNYPVTLVTDSRDWLETQYPTHTSIVDNVIFISNKPSNDPSTFYHLTTRQYRTFRDGTDTHKSEFKNDIRVKTYEITPYDETLVIDCDYIVNDSILNFCWEQPNDFLIFKKAQDLSYYRYDPLFDKISDTSIDFYWATVFWFRKNKNTETFFKLLEHIQDNWNFYRYLYQISYTLYRNDYAFSIAIHIMNGFQKGDWAKGIPGTLYYTTDRDLILSHTDKTMKFLIEKENLTGQYTAFKTDSISVHVMNKFSIARLADEVSNV